MQVANQTFHSRVCVAAALAQAAIMKAQGISARNNAVSPLDLLADLQERISQATNSLNAVMQNCATDRHISPENSEKIAALKNEVNLLAAQQQLLKDGLDAAELVNVGSPSGRLSQPEGLPTNAGSQRLPATPANNKDRTEKHDFIDFNEFTRALVNASGKGGSGQPDARLRRSNAAPGSFTSGITGPDGGFVIPPAFQDGIMEIVFAPDSFAGRCDPHRTTGRQLTIPFDPNAVYAPGGIKASWRGEGETGTQTKVEIEERELKLECVTGIVPITAEMLEDSPNIGDYVQRGLGRAVDWALTSAIMRGSGVKRPRGILAGDPSVPADKAGRIIVPKEVGQAAGTVVYKNILKMWAKLNGMCRMNAVWVITQDVETELLTMTGPDNKLIYSPVPLNEKPYTTLLGRPVIVHPVASQIGQEGDIALIDFKQYALLTRSQNGLKYRYEASMYFLENIQQFALDLRVGGQPLWHKPQPNDESGTSFSSYAVTLQARL